MGVFLRMSDLLAEPTSKTDLLAKPWRRFKDPDPWAESVYESLKEEIVTHELLEKVGLEFFNVLLIGRSSF